MSTNVEQFFSDLDGGVFNEKLSMILSEVGAAVVDNGKKGKVVIEFDFAQIATSHQVHVSHTLKYQRPTKRGKKAEDDKTATPMYVGRGGKLTFFPENQGQMFDKKGQTPGPGQQVDIDTGEIK